MSKIRLLMCCISLFSEICIAYPTYNAKTFKLKNDIEVICIEKRNVPVVAFSIWYRCGSKCDAIAKSGVAHYLEHMAFETKNGKFNTFLESIGAERNAFTSLNTICFYEIFPKEYFEDVVFNEADRLKSIDINDDVFNAEKGAILEERSMTYDNNHNNAFSECINANLFNREIGGISIIGWKHEIENLKKEDLLSYYKKWLIPNETVIIVIGDIDIESVRSILTKYFEPIASSPNTKINYKDNKINAVKDVTYRSEKVGNLCTLEYCYKVPFYAHNNFRKSVVLSIIMSVLNQNAHFIHKTMSNTLRIASELTFSYIFNYFQCDILNISIECNGINDLNKSKVAWEFLKNRLINEGISQTDLDCAKKRELYAAAYKKDDILQISFQIGWHMMFGYTFDDIQKINDVIESITLDECNNVIKEVFSTPYTSMSQMLPKYCDRDD